MKTKILACIVVTIITIGTALAQLSNSTTIDILNEFMTRKDKLSGMFEVFQTNDTTLVVDITSNKRKCTFYAGINSKYAGENAYHETIGIYWKGVKVNYFKEENGYSENGYSINIKEGKSFIFMYVDNNKEENKSMFFIIYPNGSGGYYKEDDNGNVIITGGMGWHIRATEMNQEEIRIFEKALKRFFDSVDQIKS